MKTMGKRTGIFCIVLGLCLLASSVGLILYNRWEDKNAASASQQILQDVQQQLADVITPVIPSDPTDGGESAHGQEVPAGDREPPAGSTEELSPPVSDTSGTIYAPEPEDDIPAPVPTMPTTKVGYNECIGILSIPVLGLELPILTDWSYEKLKVAPCHYYGSYYEKNFVIAGHNYRAHFKRFPELQQGDLIIFTDVTNTAHYYEVVLLETLAENATEQMITSGFDLSLYTCTPGGGAGRVTVRCSSVTK